ncbi:hypothetical protein M9H77_00083 [Catharanthus roseus]|nr:hypothetical protein M9H77_00083 [Catharanthus roseus]
MRKGMQTQGLVEEAEMKIKMQVGEEKTMKEMQTEGLVEKGEAEKIGNEQLTKLKAIDKDAEVIMKMLFEGEEKTRKEMPKVLFSFVLGVSRPYCEVGPWVDWVQVDSGS